jgi:hypothetical protein
MIGCRPAEQIDTYNVPKQAAPRVVAASASAEATDRMLAAILPDGDKAWFFKIVGPLTEVDERADKIAEFFASVRVAAGKPRPDWQLPDGWVEQPGSGMRVATITIPSSGKPLELSVTSLPWTDTQAELLSNVNRWRGQLQLAPIDPSGLAECTRELRVGDATLTVVDLRGRMQDTGMTPPFASGTRATPSGSGSRPVSDPAAATGLPAGHPPIAGAGAGGNGAGDGPLKYESPDGWESLPASGIRKAAFRVADGPREAVVTVIDFPAASGPMLADPLANVNRWRGEVGLKPLAADDLPAALEPIEIAGLQANYVEAVPDAKSNEPNADRGTLAAMATSNGVIWFFKISGDRDLVVAQREKFRSFLKSVQLNARDDPSGGH